MAADRSTTRLLLRPPAPAAERVRSASTVDRRSSCSVTVIPRNDRRAPANSSAMRALGPAAPDIDNGCPTTTSETPFSSAILAIERMSSGGPVGIVPNGTANVFSGSEMATPILASPRSSPRIRPLSATLEQFFQASGNPGEGILHGRRVLAAGKRQRRFAAGPSTHCLRRRLEKLRRVDTPRDQVLA